MGDIQFYVPSARERMEMTQEEFAEKIGRSRPFLAQVEAGRKSVPWEMSLRIVDVAGILWIRQGDHRYFLGRVDE